MAAKEKGIWGLLDKFEGDKVIWMIVILLILMSIVSVFSSTPLLALEQGGDRIAIVREQLIIAVVGLLVITACYNIRSIGFFRLFAQLGYAVSLLLLVCLVAKVRTPVIRAAEINGAWRILKVFGLQIHVYEVVKVAMVMYLAWAVNALREDSFTAANYLSTKFKRLSFLSRTFWKKLIYIYFPIVSICVLMLHGGTSSTLFFAMIMFLVIYVGGVRLNEVALLALVVAGYVALVVGLYKASAGRIKLSDRIVTAIGRVDDRSEDNMTIITSAPRNSKAFQDALDKEKQPVSAMIAIKEGGLLGKGPGRSTQRYVVPVIFGDYMYSFIVEEYGILGGIFVIILYVSLLARGAMIAKDCDNYFAKVAVAGLILLISSQAIMHIAINVHLVPQTGQTLPMISHGASSFLVFSIAFGIILSISRMVRVKMKRKERDAQPILVREEERPRDEVHDTISDLNDFQDTI